MPVINMMPTAGRLAAAAGLLAVALLVSEQIKALWPEYKNFGYFTYVNMALGALCGWIITGRRLGRGYVAAIGSAVTGMVALILWALLVHCSYEMILRSLGRRYEGPIEAIIAVFEIAVEYGGYALQGPVLTLLIGGAIGVGLVAEFVAKRWP